MKIIYFVLFLILSINCKTSRNTNHASIKSDGIAQGEFKGYHQINLLFKNVVFDESQNSEFTILKFVGLDQKQISEILGSFQGFGASNNFKNSKPNSVNMFLWQNIFGSIAEILAKECQQPTAKLHPEFNPLLQAYCTTPNKQNAYDLWLYLIGFSADAEFELLWKEIEQLPQNQNKSENTYQLLYIYFLNPHFLLSK